MTHTSLDGRSIRPSKITPKLTQVVAANLRPASPPKKNPWLQLTVPALSSEIAQEFPALPGADAVSEKGIDVPVQAKDVPEIEDTVPERTDAALEQPNTELIQANVVPESVEAVPVAEEAVAEEAVAEEAVAEPADTMLEEINPVLEQANAGLEQGDGSSASEETMTSSNDLWSSIPLRAKDLLNENKISDSISTCSSGSRRLFEAAAHRASETLWKYPFGADVVVYAESATFRVHRNIVVQKSGWFRDNLPPPNEDGMPIDIHLPWAAGAVGPCLMFMYTNKVDICEKDKAWPLNSVHLPRCVLGYCAAVALRIGAMSHHLLQIVESTAADLAEYLGTYFINREMDRADGVAFSYHLVDALDIIHSETAYDLMRPMRLAMAAVLDASLPCLLRQPAFAKALKTSPWLKHSASIATDQMEYRKALGYSYPLKGTVLPSEDELEALLNCRLKGEDDWAEIIHGHEESSNTKQDDKIAEISSQDR